MNKFDFEANRGNIPKNNGFDFEANRKPVPEPLPFAKPFDFEANRGNLPSPAKIRYDFANNPNNYKPNPETITIVEDENRERNSWGFNSMLAGASLIGAGALAYNTYRNMRNKNNLAFEFAELIPDENIIYPELIPVREAANTQAQNIIMRDIAMRRDMTTKSQIIHPPPDRGLVSNPIEDTLMGLQSSILSNTRTEAIARGQAIRKGIRDVRVDIASRVQTRADNNARTQPRTNPFAGRPQRGGTTGDSKDLIRNRKYFNDNL